MPLSFLALAFHNEFKYSYADVCINSRDNYGTLCKNFGNFGNYEARMCTAGFPAN